MKQCVDPKLNNDYPPKAIAKVFFFVLSLQIIIPNLQDFNAAILNLVLIENIGF